jgi:oxygen-independent coproporphyrinogen-3 oxidase
MDSLATTTALAPEHVSAYCLTYEEDTEYFRRFQNGEIGQDDDRNAEFFERTMDHLGDSGYAQYEISNYARPGCECLHNFAYWTGEEYEGLGPSAFSTRGGIRRRNVADTTEFIRRVGAGGPWHDFEEVVDEATARAESLAFSLRTVHGVDASEVSSGKAADLMGAGLVEPSSGRLVLTRRGRLLADAVAAELI